MELGAEPHRSLPLRGGLLAGGAVEAFAQVGEQEHGVEQAAAQELFSGRILGAEGGDFGGGQDDELDGGLAQVGAGPLEVELLSKAADAFLGLVKEVLHAEAVVIKFFGNK